MNDLKSFGTISRSHGLKGAFKINVHTAGITAIEKDEPVFIQLQGGPVPFFVEECSLASHDKMTMKIADVDTLEQADLLIGKDLLLETSKFDNPDVDATDSLIGFTVYDENKGNIGNVEGIMSTAQHPILEINQNGKTILVPWVEEIVKDVDLKKQAIKIDAPDGLIDLYVNG